MTTKYEEISESTKNYLIERAEAISTKDVTVTVRIVNSNNPFQVMVNNGSWDSYDNEEALNAYLTGVYETLKTLKKY